MKLTARSVHPVFGLLALVLALGCKPAAHDANAKGEIAFDLTNTFHLDASSQFAFVESTKYSYSSMDGKTVVHVACLTGSSAAASNLLAELDLKKISWTRTTPIKDTGPDSQIPWWQPENYGECDVFRVDSPKDQIHCVYGYLCKAPTNHLLFLEVRRHW